MIYLFFLLSLCRLSFALIPAASRKGFWLSGRRISSISSIIPIIPATLCSLLSSYGSCSSRERILPDLIGADVM
jgi:hypothetical protein